MTTETKKAPVSMQELLSLACKGQGGNLGWVAIFGIGISAFTLAVSLLGREIIGRGVDSQHLETVTVVAIGIAIAVLFGAALRVLRTLMVNGVGTSVMQVVNAKLIDNLAKISPLNRNVSANSVSLAMSQLSFLRTLIPDLLVSVVDVVVAAVYLAVSCLISVKITVMMLGVWMVVVVAQGCMQRYIDASARDARKAQGRLIEGATEMFRLMELLRLTNAIGSYKSDATRAAQVEEKANTGFQQLIAVNGVIGTVGLALVSSGVTVLSSIEIIGKTMSMGDMVACSTLVYAIMQPLLSLPAIRMRLAQARASSDLRSILDADCVEAGRILVSPTEISGSIAFDGVRLSFADNPGRYVLNGISMRWDAGSKFGLLGHNDAGKSALLNLLSGKFAAVEGSVKIGGYKVEDLDPSTLSKIVAYCPQEDQLIRGTLRENLLLGLDGDVAIEVIKDVCDGLGVTERLTDVRPNGLDMVIVDGGVNLSPGLRKLVCMARTLIRLKACGSRILMIDEGTAPTDSDSENRQIAYIGKVVAETGVTLIVVSHREAMLRLCTEGLLILGAGKIVDKASIGPQKVLSVPSPAQISAVSATRTTAAA